MFHVLNTVTLDGHTYTAEDIRAVVPLSFYGLDGTFYGGRAKCIALTDQEGVLLIIDKQDKDGQLQIMDIGVEETLALTNLPIEHLRNLCIRKGLEFTSRHNKRLLVSSLIGQYLPPTFERGEDDAGE